VRRERIVITGLGLVTAAGRTPEQVWSAIESERSGLGRLTLFDSPRCGHMPVAQVREDPAARSGLREGSRTDHLAVYAARRAFGDAGLDSSADADRREVGVVLGTSTGGILDSEEFLRRLMLEDRLDVGLLRFHLCSSPANAVANALGLLGFRATVSNACASGATAIATACEVLESGEAKVVLAGGSDSLARLTVNGFCSLLNVAPDGCRPFDAERAGLSLGEGAAMVVLETEAHARARGARIRAHVAGHGSTCDAYHPTAPRPDGSGALAAMRAALDDAGLNPTDVGYVNAHGTGTVDNDLAEARALIRLFDGHPPPVSSTKRFFGHTLAAAGAIETVVCILALQRQRVPANLGLRRVDPAMGFEPIRHTSDGELSVAMTNSFGFGGNNCVLLIEQTTNGHGQGTQG